MINSGGFMCVWESRAGHPRAEGVWRTTGRYLRARTRNPARALHKLREKWWMTGRYMRAHQESRASPTQAEREMVDDGKIYARAPGILRVLHKVREKWWTTGRYMRAHQESCEPYTSWERNGGRDRKIKCARRLSTSWELTYSNPD